MTESLALKYRPRAFSDLTGQTAVKVVLREMVRRGRVPSGLLFSGPRGTGKTTTGRTLAAALNCETPANGEPCATCPACKGIFGSNSIDVHEIDAASHGNVADVRQILEMLQYSVGANKRVIMFDEAHSMSTEAFNALLKTLEEPPPDTIFVLLTTEPNRIIKTVLSRLMVFEFTQIGVDDIAARLQTICAAEDLTVEPALIDLIAQRAQGGMRDAVMTLDQVTRVGVATVRDFRKMLGEDDFAPACLRAMAMGDTATTFATVDRQLTRSGDAAVISSALVSCLRDLLVLHAGGQLRHQGDSFEVRKALCALIPADRAVAALGEFWKLKTQVRAGDDARALLDLAVVMASEALRVEAAPASTAARPAAPDAQKLSLDQIALLVNGQTLDPAADVR